MHLRKELFLTSCLGILRAESQRKVYKKIEYLQNREKTSIGLSNLNIPCHIPITSSDQMKQLPDTPNYWETILAPQDIERLLLSRNQHHFRQAEGTPFTLPPLSIDIGYNADGFAADFILSNQYETNNLPAATALLIKHLQARQLQTLDGHITKKQVLGKLHKWDKHNTTSPSGIHLGHYDCIWRDARLPADDPIHKEFQKKQDKLLFATVDLLNYALKHSYVFTRWKKVVNVMLQKDPGNPRIHRLRVIHLYEADYNLSLTAKWRQAMLHAEDNHLLLNDGLYGSRPGRSAHDPRIVQNVHEAGGQLRPRCYIMLRSYPHLSRITMQQTHWHVSKRSTSQHKNSGKRGISRKNNTWHFRVVILAYA
jgi:hypothetical protein